MLAKNDSEGSATRPRSTNSMGRQIHFYMLLEDEQEFVRAATKTGDVLFIVRDDANVADVRAVTDLGAGCEKTHCLWNRRLLPLLQREWIPNPGYYRADVFELPLIEFTKSFGSTWEGQPALGQGRLWGDFDPRIGKPPEFTRWYETLTRWIRKNYQKSPAKMGGYLGPAAQELYNRGGYLLPQFLPPRTDAWLAEIAKQHVPQNPKPR